MELTAFQYADGKSLLYFPINFMEVSLLGFQAYRNLCLPPDDTKLLVRRLSVVEQNIIRHPPICVNLNSIVGAKRRKRFGNRLLTIQCCSDRDQYLIPSRINKLAKIIPRPRWLRHENCLKSVLIGLCFIVSTILFNCTCLRRVGRNMKNPAHDFVLSSASTILSGLVGDELRYWYNFEWVHGGKILPPTHPTRIRVESIFGEIINALNVGLKLEDDKRMTVLSADPKIGRTGNYYSVSSDMREEVFNRLAHIYTSSHLEGYNWKLEVVDSRKATAYYIRGLRRIGITTRMIEYYCNSEKDIAAILGHEVGHWVCSISETNYLKLVTFIVYTFPGNFTMVPLIIFVQWFKMREELVADYIALMLMASAGYDPSSFPVLMERMTRDNDVTYYMKKLIHYLRRYIESYHPSGKTRIKSLEMKKLIDYLRRYIESYHPSGKTRIKSLEQVMGEAVTIYEQVRGAANTC